MKGMTMDAPIVDYGDMVMAQMAKRLEAAEVEIENLRKVAKMARLIKDWHDNHTDGMVRVEHLQALWQSLHDLDAIELNLNA